MNDISEDSSNNNCIRKPNLVVSFGNKYFFKYKNKQLFSKKQTSTMHTKFEIKVIFIFS